MEGFRGLALAAACLLVQGGFGQTPSQRKLIDLAKESVIAEVRHEPAPESKDQAPPKPVFVTIEINGKVLGCRGDLTARTASLEDEVILTARSAAQHDPRHRPLTADEIRHFLVTVTIVNGLQPISTVDGLEPKDGLVVEHGEAKGIVLPWEGKDPRVRLGWGYRKAGLPTGTPVQLYKLIAERFRG